jgi:hypothetical protein
MVPVPALIELLLPVIVPPEAVWIVMFPPAAVGVKTAPWRVTPAPAVVLPIVILPVVVEPTFPTVVIPLAALIVMVPFAAALLVTVATDTSPRFRALTFMPELVAALVKELPLINSIPPEVVLVTFKVPPELTEMALAKMPPVLAKISIPLVLEELDTLPVNITPVPVVALPISMLPRESIVAVVTLPVTAITVTPPVPGELLMSPTLTSPLLVVSRALILTTPLVVIKPEVVRPPVFVSIKMD